MPESSAPLPDFTRWPSFPFEGQMRVKTLAEPVAVEPPRKGEDSDDCVACNAPDEAYIWVSERWRVRAMDRPTGLPMVLILETRSHLDLGDLPNLLAAELGVMTVRLERAVRSLDGVARVHVNRWGDGSAHMHLWFLARPYGQLQLRGTFLSLWDDILPPIPEAQWRENLALVAAWLAEFGGRPLAEPPRIQWMAPGSLADQATAEAALLASVEPADPSNDSPATAGDSSARAGNVSPPAVAYSAEHKLPAMAGSPSAEPDGPAMAGSPSAEPDRPATAESNAEPDVRQPVGSPSAAGSSVAAGSQSESAAADDTRGTAEQKPTGTEPAVAQPTAEAAPVRTVSGGASGVGVPSSRPAPERESANG